jgi:polyhydroxyalkanoate synthesis regulator phasin
MLRKQVLVVQIVGGCVVVKGSRENLNVLTKLKKSDGETVGSTLTVEHLTKAIKNSIDKAGMPEEEARAMAQHVMNFFGYSERIIDNVLEPEDRDAFYMLEDAGILMTEREETTLYDGREWRIHYWMFRKERIHELISGRKSIDMGPGGADNVYDEIPDDIWSRE